MMQVRIRVIHLGFIFMLGFVGVYGYFANFGMLTRTKTRMVINHYIIVLTLIFICKILFYIDYRLKVLQEL